MDENNKINSYENLEKKISEISDIYNKYQITTKGYFIFMILGFSLGIIMTLIIRMVL